MKARKFLVAALTIVLALAILARLDALQPAALAQTTTAAKPHPVTISAVSTDNGNQLLYRLWSNGDIDVRLVNPLRTQAHDWPNSDKAGLSFQEGWKLFIKGE